MIAIPQAATLAAEQVSDGTLIITAVVVVVVMLLLASNFIGLRARNGRQFSLKELFGTALVLAAIAIVAVVAIFSK